MNDDYKKNWPPYQIKSLPEYFEHYESAKNHPNEFWCGVADSFYFHERGKSSSIKEGDLFSVNYKWFAGSKLNLCENVLDRFVYALAGAPNLSKQTALIFVSNDENKQPIELTFEQVLKRVSDIAHFFQSLGLKKGDTVCLYMGMVPDLVMSVLACARLGLIHSVVFGGFSAISLSDRLKDANALALITSDVAVRGDKKINLLSIAQEAIKNSPVKHFIVHRHNDHEQNEVSSSIIDFHQGVLKNSKNEICKAQSMDAEDPLFILYTSGSTGRPKGVMHTTAGYMVWAAYSFSNVFQTKINDRFWCTADVGWITGHTYLTYAPMMSGVTTVMFEGVPTYPAPDRFWKIIESVKVTHFYTAPTAIRALMAYGPEYPMQYEMKSLRVLGSVGEPINEEAYDFYHTHIGKGRCPIVDTWWQTETGGILITSLAGITPSKACHAGFPLPGVVPVLLDSNGNELIGNAVEGNLCLKSHHPGLARTVYGDHARFIQTYFSTYKGHYFTGDGAKRDEEGLYRIIGRVDDVINVSGHRIGTAEVEDAINEHDAVVESAVVGVPHAIKGEALYAFIVVYESEYNSIITEKEKLKFKTSLYAVVTRHLGSFARPDTICIVKGLPKTRSGKIMRRILRKAAIKQYDQLGDTSTLLDPNITLLLQAGVEA